MPADAGFFVPDDQASQGEKHAKEKNMKVTILRRWVDHRADGISVSYWPGECDLPEEQAKTLIQRKIAINEKPQKKEIANGRSKRK